MLTQIISTVLVALHAESVDRNIYDEIHVNKMSVALHAESVDRNMTSSIVLIGNNVVALHAESVDRNNAPVNIGT